MKTIKVTRSLLLQALEHVIENQTHGLVPVTVQGVRGVIATGEAFEIDSVEIDVAPKQKPATPAAADLSGRFSAPTGAGKIRLAARDGERL